jgi:1-acyl-sn-glycerol-3-phosphate acyltransferase
MSAITRGRPRGWQFSLPATVAREVTARVFGLPVRWLVGGPRVIGLANVADVEAPVIICPTHASHFDFSTLRLALGPHHRRRLAPAVAADYFATSRLRWFFAAWLGAFPFERRRRGATESFEAALDLLAAGWSVLVFPEGTRSRTGDVGAFKAGVGILAARSGRPVLPVRMIGTHAVLPPGARRPRRAKVEVRFGSPLVATPGEDPREFTRRLEAAVLAL